MTLSKTSEKISMWLGCHATEGIRDEFDTHWRRVRKQCFRILRVERFLETLPQIRRETPKAIYLYQKRFDILFCDMDELDEFWKDLKACYGINTNHRLTSRNAITPAVCLSPPTELPTSADVPPSPYQTLWDYAQRMWASDTDKFKICQHISSGPGNYSACVEELVPGVDGRTLKTNRFHAVLGVLNKEIGAELRLEVYRFGEQILVCERGRKPTGHKRKSKKTTTKKTTTKRKK
ncbi:MAG: hypothetical protein ACK42H_13860 [Planctomycetota bacterium]